jgi:hypothetical protein
MPRGNLTVSADPGCHNQNLELAMKTLISLTILALGTTGLPLVAAADAGAPAFALQAEGLWAGPAADEVERRGRKRPRVPGGSGCDDPRDLVEHPQCRP